MALQAQTGFLGDGMSYTQPETQQVDQNLLFSILTVINRYKKDAVGLIVSRNEVFESSLYCTVTRSFFNRALSDLKDKGLITLTPFTVSLTPSGFNHIYGVGSCMQRTPNAF